MNKKFYNSFGSGIRTLGVALLLGAFTFSTVPSFAANAGSSEEITQQKNIDVTVKVFEEDGTTPIIGATVVLVGNTSKARSTDVTGVAVLNDMPSNGSLSVSYIGTMTQVVPINGQQTISVILKSTDVGLDQVVVVGFGSQKKINLTGSVSVVDAKQLESRPVQNVSQALQGMVPGLNFSVNSSGGELNNSMSVNIRGGGTIGSGSSGAPLILIDGMEGNMNTMNPQDIESISVLKDASASAVYGSRAPFGVILITTKKGKAGRTTVNYNNSFRWTDPLLTPHMLDSWSFANYWNEAATNGGEAKPFDDYTLQKIQDYQAGKITDQTERSSPTSNNWKSYNSSWGNNDWFDVFYKDWVFSQEHNLSISGGTEKVQYYISGNLLDQNGLLNFSNDKYDRYALTTKINAKLADWVSISGSVKFQREGYNRAAYQTGLFYHNIARRWPTLALTHPKDPVNPIETPNYGNSNEITQLTEGGRDINEKDYLYQQFQVVFEPIKNWHITAEANYRTEVTFNHWEVLPAYMQMPDGDLQFVDFDGGGGDYYGGMSRVSESSGKVNFFSPNIYTDYSYATNNGHNFKIMAGFNSEEYNYRNLSGTRDGLITPNVPTLNTATANDKTSGGYSDWATAGFFGRINYDYKERYLVEVSGRYDGSSRFIGDKRWNMFPSFSAGWNMAKENFMEPVKWVSLLKPRFSWGQLGNGNTTAYYPFYQTMGIGKDYFWLINNVKPSVYANAPGLVSSLMTWEKIESIDLAVDFGLLNNRLRGTVGLFQRTTKDMIGPAPSLPNILGTAVPTYNNCDLESRGWELEISWSDYIQSAGIQYSARLVLSDGKTKVTRYPNNPSKSLDLPWYEGRMSGDIWGYTTIGIAQTKEEMEAHLAKVNQNALGSNWGAGDIMYADTNNDGKIDTGKNTADDPGDRKIIGNSTPRYAYGFTGNIAWKGFDFQFYLQGVAKRDYMPGGPYMWGADGGMWQSAGFETHLDYWRPNDTESVFGPNTDAYFARPSWTTGKNKQNQTRYMQDASYIRLKNIQLGYTLSQEISKKFGVTRMRVYVSGENLWTGTKMIKTFDPETISGGWGDGKVYPLSKVLSGGLSITF